MTIGAAESRAEMPGALPELGGRKPLLAGKGAVNVTGRKDEPLPKTDGLMEAIVSRGNMMAAYNRVMRNKGAPGVDDMPVTLRRICKRGRGRSMTQIKEEANPKLRGWLNYFRLAKNESLLQELDGWLRRKLRCILWRQWKRSYTRAKNLIKLGLSENSAWRYVRRQRGPWASVGTNVMHRILDNTYFDNLGFQSLLSQYGKLSAFHEPPCTEPYARWCGRSAGETPPPTRLCKKM